MNKDKVIEKTISWGIIGLVFLLPLFFLPITSEFYVFNKQTLLILTTGFFLIIWAWGIFRKGEVVFRKTPLDLVIFLFALAHLLTTLIASPNKIEGLLDPAGSITILILTFFYFLITNHFRPITLAKLFSALTASATLLSLIAIYQFLGLGIQISQIVWLQDKLFSLTGGPFLLLSFLGPVFFIALLSFLKKINRKDWLVSGWLFSAILLISLGMILTIYQIIPGKETSITTLPYQEGWSIGVESFKQSPLVGVGAGNYLSAFNRFRPIRFNRYQFWNNRFARASNYPLELLTGGGLVLLTTYLFLIIKAGRLIWQKYQNPQGQEEPSIPLLLAAVLAILTIHFLLPINFLTLFLTYLFLGLLSSTLAEKKTIRFASPAPAQIISATTSLLVLIGFYCWGRIYLADFYFRRSLNTLAQGQAIEAYNFQIKAINLNPRREPYRIAYSQTNFALADALARQEELSDQDRTNISLLIQQAVREAKTATVLNPARADYWENLAQIYRNLINSAQGADQWTIATYQQAIMMDPINPRLRVDLGGFFYSLGNHETALRYFQDAIGLKPDYANAYYNLAISLRELGRYQEAVSALQTAVSLVPLDSPDYYSASKELEELREKLPAPEAVEETTETEEGREFESPEPFPSPVIEPPLELPEELGPETEEAFPESSPTPSPTP